MIKRLAHVCIHTTDLDETLTFYTRVLGMEKGFDFTRDGNAFGFYLKLGADSFIEVFKGDAAPIGNIKHLAIEVDDMDAMIERVRSHGVEMADKRLGADQSWQVWVTDPNGVRIEFHEYTAESRQRIGGICELG